MAPILRRSPKSPVQIVFKIPRYVSVNVFDHKVSRSKRKNIKWVKDFLEQAHFTVYKM